MDKNTIWAIVLSGLVLIGSIFVESVFIAPKQQAARQQQIEAQQAADAQARILAKEAEEMISSVVKEDVVTEAENLNEEHFTITTNKAAVTFTNRGGDIISYKLLEHSDKTTGEGVEMVRNVTDSNRAFALAFGDSNVSCVNDIFEVQQNGNVIVFFKNFNVKDEAGKTHEFRLAKRYEFKADDYAFLLGIEINPVGDTAGLNVGGVAYTLRTAPQIGPEYNKNDRYEVRQYLALNKNKKIKKNLVSKYYNTEYDWAGIAGKYFTTLVKPVDPTTMSSSVRTIVDEGNAQLFLTRNAVEGNAITQDLYYVYVGPRSEKELIRYNSKDNNAWNLVNIKFNQALSTSGIFSFLEVALKWSLEMVYKLVKNWGVAIIILTIILKIILFPLNKKSAVGSLKMQQLQPQVQAIQNKYKDDQQKMSMEMQKLYKQAGYNPAAGCLPMILQMVILISLYNVFNNYFEFRGASFISGWIDDLSVGDYVWQWDKQIPVLSTFLGNSIRILPFVYLLTQLINGVITQAGQPSGGAQQAQMKFMMFGLPCLFFFMFYNVPSGLMLYWTVSNIFQMGQQLAINSIMKKKRNEVVAAKPVNKNEAKFKGGKKKTR